MFKFSSFIFFVMMLSFSIQAQPTIKFETQNYNFNTIYEKDGKASHTFTFKNTGDKDLKITGITTGCNCTSPYYTDTVLKPQETGTVIVSFDPIGKNGAFWEHVVVNSNAWNGSISLSVKGSVVPMVREKKVMRRIDSFPYPIGALRLDASYKTFGNVYADRSDTVSFFMYNYSKQTIMVQGISDVPPYMTALIKNSYIEPGEITEMRIVLNSKASNWYGQMNQTFYLSTSEAGVPESAIHMNANIVERFPKHTKKYLRKAPKAVLVSPSTVNLGKILKNTKVDFSYELKNEGKKPLIIRNVVSVCGCTFTKTDTTIIEPGKTGKVTATFDTQGRDAEQEKFITIITNDPLNSEIKVKFIANIVENPNALDK